MMKWISHSKWLVFLSVILLSTAGATTLPTTDARFYRPFEEPVADQAKLVLTKILPGECRQHSMLDKRSDAWQCQSGTQVFDPCFIKNYVEPDMALCVLAPWDSNSVVINLKSQALPPRNNTNNDTLDMSTDDPWAITLMDGTQCIKTSNLGLSIDDQPIKYTCNNHAFLLGYIQRCELIWKMLYLSSRTSHSFKMVEIKMAWY
jgi:hypothetical protein